MWLKAEEVFDNKCNIRLESLSSEYYSLIFITNCASSDDDNSVSEKSSC